VERLRNFKARLDMGRFTAGSSPKMSDLAHSTQEKIRGALEDDMNTAQALAAVFDMVREANAAGDEGRLFRDDVPALQKALTGFDEIFSVLKDDDAEKIKLVLQWARSEGRLSEAAIEASTVSDEDVEKLIEQRQQARKSRDFAKADAVRKQLAEAGIILEDTKEGLRWKRK